MKESAAGLSDDSTSTYDTSNGGCTDGCTGDAKNAGETGCKPSEKAGQATPAETTGDGKLGGDFAAALAMIATLPLSDAEKAEAVRRLLTGARVATPTAGKGTA